VQPSAWLSLTANRFKMLEILLFSPVALVREAGKLFDNLRCDFLLNYIMDGIGVDAKSKCHFIDMERGEFFRIS
jgi:hypothetical protein